MAQQHPRWLCPLLECLQVAVSEQWQLCVAGSGQWVNGEWVAQQISYHLCLETQHPPDGAGLRLRRLVTPLYAQQLQACVLFSASWFPLSPCCQCFHQCAR
ncbi:unnamed protein product [Ostreobium quekettii]|uniref:Secreted protein n=1 Tax=Ostreobium quekettii TaxID=121088 RepID=A0A8S1J4G6_9CHLO|nr:unnamed protein product [Ostreobium quekettii]